MFNLGKWLPDEERLLAQAVYDLSGCEPGKLLNVIRLNRLLSL